MDLGERAVALARELIAIDSVSPSLAPTGAGEARLAALLGERLAASGFAVREVPCADPRRPSLLATHVGTRPGPHVVVNGHLDTVPVEGMPHPFEPRVEGEKLFGRGASDMKAGIAGLVVAAEELAAHDLPGRLTVALVADEEDGSTGAEAVLAALDDRPDVCLIAEPTWLDLAEAHRGFEVLRVGLAGRAAHSSQPEEGRDVVPVLARILTAVVAHDATLRAVPADPQLARGSLMTTVVTGGSAPFTVAAAGQLLVERRTLPTEDAGIGLANAGVQITPEILAAAAVSPITWGIVIGLVIGKIIGIWGTTAVMKLFRMGDFGPGLTVDRLLGGAALAGIGFTISLFIVDLAIDDAAAQNEARVGVLAASILAFALAALIFRLSDAFRPQQESGRVLVRAVDPRRDHVWGDPDAPLTIVEYGDFQCEFCLKASGSVQQVIDELGTDGFRYVWRHAPLTRFHPNALAAAEASEAAALQGRFFEFERALFVDQDEQLPSHIIRRAQQLGLDVEQFEKDLGSAEVAARVRDDMLDAEAMDITAVPTFFINGRRHVGPYDARSLIAALQDPTPDPTRKPSRVMEPDSGPGHPA